MSSHSPTADSDSLLSDSNQQTNLEMTSLSETDISTSHQTTSTFGNPSFDYILDLRIDEKKEVEESKPDINQKEVNMMTIDGIDRIDGRVKVKRSDNEKFGCNQCGKKYASSSNLSRHKQTHRSIDSEAARSCPECLKVYVSMPALAMHMLTHRLQHKCSTCGKSFSRSWLLQCHLRSHSGEKPYGCAHCGRSFGDRSNLRAHMHLHTTEKLHNCDFCGKNFALKSYLNKHTETCRTQELKESSSSSVQTEELSGFEVNTIQTENSD
ncbi:uncharacterized protein LOC142343407 [Convolutriloba macropyga]|uniref:uncharacterized protein LOC142343407 n=1 Tax=Convolutriloba macropyga TaxID=536237 RepID=UPI003F51FC77